MLQFWWYCDEKQTFHANNLNWISTLRTTKLFNVCEFLSETTFISRYMSTPALMSLICCCFCSLFKVCCCYFIHLFAKKSENNWTSNETNGTSYINETIYRLCEMDDLSHLFLSLFLFYSVLCSLFKRCTNRFIFECVCVSSFIVWMCAKFKQYGKKWTN